MGRPVQVDELLSGVTDANGKVLSAGRVYFYAAGTTTDKAVWTDGYKNHRASQPVELDGAGRALIFADGNYKIVVKDEDDTTVYTWDELKYYFGGFSSQYPTADGGFTGTWTITVDPAPTEYKAGDMYLFPSPNTQTGVTGVTLNVNSLGAQNVYWGSGSEKVPAQASQVGHMMMVMYDGTDFRQLNCDSAESQTSPNLTSFGAGGSMTYSGSGGVTVRARNSYLHIAGAYTGTAGGTAAAYITCAPNSWTVKSSTPADYAPMCGTVAIVEGSSTPIAGYMFYEDTANEFRIYKHDNADFTLGTVAIYLNFYAQMDLS